MELIDYHQENFPVKMILQDGDKVLYVVEKNEYGAPMSYQFEVMNDRMLMRGEGMFYDMDCFTEDLIPKKPYPPHTGYDFPIETLRSGPNYVVREGKIIWTKYAIPRYIET